MLTGRGSAEAWLDAGDHRITVCQTDPGCDVDLVVVADNRQMHRWLIGLVPFRAMLADGEVQLMGPRRLARAFPTWFDTTFFAAGIRRAETRLADDGSLAS